MRKKILFIVYNFYQAGSQRHMYEIARALDKSRYQIDFLKFDPLKDDNGWKEHYYKPTLQEGCKVYLLDDFKVKTVRKYDKPIKLANRILKKLRLTKIDYSARQKAKDAAELRRRLANFINEYDVVNYSGIAVFKSCEPWIQYDENHLIHILTAKFQYPQDPYHDWDKNKKYHFVSGFMDDYINVELEHFKNYRHSFFPLCLKLDDQIIPLPEERDVFRIGIFTRLHFLKPLEPFIYAFQLLLDKGINAELHIFGNGDPRESGVMRHVEFTGLTDKVFFRGHQEDLKECLRENKIHISWFQAFAGIPGGYAAYELTVMGLPHIYWDFYPLNRSRNEMAKMPFPCFWHIQDFVDYTAGVLKDGSLSNLSKLQREAVISRHDIGKHIHRLEEIFENNK